MKAAFRKSSNCKIIKISIYFHKMDKIIATKKDSTTLFQRQVGYCLVIVQVSLFCFLTILWIRCCSSSIGPDPVLILQTFSLPESSSISKTLRICSNLRRKSILNFLSTRTDTAKGLLNAFFRCRQYYYYYF